MITASTELAYHPHLICVNFLQMQSDLFPRESRVARAPLACQEPMALPIDCRYNSIACPCKRSVMTSKLLATRFQGLCPVRSKAIRRKCKTECACHASCISENRRPNTVCRVSSLQPAFRSPSSRRPPHNASSIPIRSGPKKKGHRGYGKGLPT
jgi:hypothetical protein